MLSMLDSILSILVSIPRKSSLFADEELLPPPLSELLSFDPLEQTGLYKQELDWLLLLDICNWSL